MNNVYTTSDVNTYRIKVPEAIVTFPADGSAPQWHADAERLIAELPAGPHRTMMEMCWAGRATASQDTAPPPAVPAPDESALLKAAKSAQTALQIALPYMQTNADGIGPDCTPVLQAIINLSAAIDLAAPAQANAWEEAVKDACTVAGELGWNEADPRASLNKLIEWHIQVALDPRVSDRAPAQAVDALNLIVRDIAELDYSSDTVLDRMEVSEADLRLIVSRHVAALAAQPAAPAEAADNFVPEHWRDKARHIVSGKMSTAESSAQAIMLLRVMLAAPAREPVALVNAVRSDIIGFLRASNDEDCANRVEEFMTAEAIMRNIAAAPVANAVQAQAVAVPTMECPKCGTDRLKAPCPGMADECAMRADAHLAAAPLPQQVAQTEDQPTLPHHTSRDAYFKMTPERKAALDADMTQLERRIAEHRKSRDRRTHDEPVAEERRHGDRRHAERRDCED